MVKDMNLQRGVNSSHLQFRNLANFKFVFSLKWPMLASYSKSFSIYFLGPTQHKLGS